MLSQKQNHVNVLTTALIVAAMSVSCGSDNKTPVSQSVKSSPATTKVLEEKVAETKPVTAKEEKKATVPASMIIELDAAVEAKTFDPQANNVYFIAAYSDHPADEMTSPDQVELKKLLAALEKVEVAYKEAKGVHIYKVDLYSSTKEAQAIVAKYAYAENKSLKKLPIAVTSKNGGSATSSSQGFISDSYFINMISQNFGLSLSGQAMVTASQAPKAQKVIMFSSPTCGHCLQMIPTVDTLKGEGYNIEKVMKSEQPALAQQYGIGGLPVFVFLDESGNEVGRISGPTTKEGLSSRLVSQQAK